MNKPYHERPDWILKAIGYYCDNYILDGQDLRKFKKGAIKEYKTPTVLWRYKCPDEISMRIYFDESPQGWSFWDGFCFLVGIRGWGIPFNDAKCSPWTNYEKRKIAKLPEVK